MTTTVGLVCKDGIVLATDHRATMGHLISDTDTKKVYQIDDFIGMTIAGSVGDAQKLVKILSIESHLYKIQREESITIKGATNLLANILNNNRLNPYSIQFIIGGMDKNGIHLYSLDALGGYLERKDFTSTGSGSPMAYSILESEYHADITLEKAIDLAIQAISIAQKRDSASGNGFEVVIINKDGYRKV